MQVSVTERASPSPGRPKAGEIPRGSLVVLRERGADMTRQHIIDRRLAGKNKSVGNRERFLRRYRDKVREAVQRAINGRSIRDIEKGEDIAIPKRDLSEPVFSHGDGGTREVVHPGNREYVRGDRIEKPQGGGGQGSGSGMRAIPAKVKTTLSSPLSKEEFMQVFFEDLALPIWFARHWLRCLNGKASARVTAAMARPTTCTWCAPCAGPWGVALLWAPAAVAKCKSWKRGWRSCVASTPRPAVRRAMPPWCKNEPGN